MQSFEDGRRATVAAWGAPQTGTFLVQPYMTTATIPQKRKPENEDTTSDSIDCICGLSYDDGSLSIACDDCGRWCHAACFDITEGEVPEEWRCWECFPRPVNKERAVKLQLERQTEIQGMMRRPSPGVEKKQRRASALAIEGSRKKRRPSILTQTQNPHTLPPRIEDEHVDICEPWNLSFVPIANDVIPHRQTREKLERAAHSWRGVTALQVSEKDLKLPRTAVQPLASSSFSHPTLSLCTNPSVRPPSYAFHTAEPVPRSKMIAPYHSTIIPSSAYLSDTLNSYAHLGMPKPFVHLIGPPLDLALDARITGDNSRFVRSGCKPNAILRPMICPKSKENERNSRSEEGKDTMGFGVFALRDLKANEEVVLGWEWDDGHAVHNLPALIESPHSFQLHHYEHLRNQMTSMLNSLSSTFTTCACGAKSNDCALNMMAAFVDGELPQKSDSERADLGPLVGSSRGFRTREKIPFSGGMTGVEMVPEPSPPAPVLNGDVRKRVFSVAELASNPIGPQPTRVKSRKGKERATDVENHASSAQAVNGSVVPPQSHSRKRRVTTGSAAFNAKDVPEATIPPKMRKRWIHKSSENLRTTRAQDVDSAQADAMQIDPDSSRMPPPPLPSYLQPTTNGFTSSPPNTELYATPPSRDISPSTHFANLSLLSPIVNNQKPFFAEARSASPNQISLRSETTASPDEVAAKNLVSTVPVKSVSFAITKPSALGTSPDSSSLMDTVKTPSPLRLLSPIDSNVSHSDTGPPAQHVPMDSPQPQILLSLPHYERNGPEQHSSDSHTPIPLSSQPPPPPRSASPMPSSSGDAASPPPSISEPSPETPPPLTVEPPSPPQASPVPQKVKTSFKDFLRRKRQQEPTLAPQAGIDATNNGTSDGGDQGGNQEGMRDLPEEPADHPSPELHNVEPTAEQPMQEQPEMLVGADPVPSAVKDPDASEDSLSDSWLVDPQLTAAGLVVQVKDTWHKRDMAGLQGVVKALVPRDGMSHLVILKAWGAKSYDSVPVTHTVPVAPRRVGDSVALISGRSKGKIGTIQTIGEGLAIVRLDSDESVVEVKVSLTCTLSKTGDTIQPEPVVQPEPEPERPAQPTSPPVEEGEIVQPSTPPPPPPPPSVKITSTTPTQPRSFLSHPSSLSRGNTRPSPPSSTPGRPRQLTPPSGPKALRIAGPKSYPQPPYPPKRNYGSIPNGMMSHPPLPKGPSADRDREREWTGSSWPSRRPPPGGWR